MMTDLWRLTATETVVKLRKRELCPLELVEAAASRIEAVEPKVNALPIRFLDEARDYAQHFGREARDNPGWLAGLPMSPLNIPAILFLVIVEKFRPWISILLEMLRSFFSQSKQRLLWMKCLSPLMNCLPTFQATL